MIRNLEPYLSEDIEYQTSLARGGDFNSTYNLLAFFCSCIERGDTPPPLLSIFVADILQKKLSEKKKKILYRHKDIHNQMNLMASSPSRGSVQSRSIKVGNKMGYSPSRAAHLGKHPPNTCVIDFCDAVRKNEISDTLFKAIVPEIKKIIKKILNSGGAGKAQRYELNLHGFREWNSKKELHIEILQDIEKHGVTATSKNLGIKKDTINSIRKRKNKLKGVQ